MANQRLDATITIGSVLERSVGKNLNIIRRGLDGVGDEIKKVTDRQRELSKQRKVLERQGRSVEALDREYEQLGRTLDDLRRKQERFERAQGAANRVGRQFGEMNRQVGRQVRNAGIAIGAASAAIFGVASSTAAAGDELAKQSRALGFNVEAYQELGYAAERSGVSAEVFNSSMTAMTKRLGEAAQGQGAAKKALDELGLSAQDLIEMEPDQALGVIADRMKDIDDPARKAALAAALFSRSGIRMTNMLNEGSAGIDALRNRARELGLVLSEETTTDSENFQDSLLNAQSALQGMKNIIGGEMIPVVGEMMDAFTEFVVTNQPQIREFAETLANGLRDAVPIIGDVVSGLGDFAGKVGSVVSKVAEMIGGWDNFGIALGVLMTSPAIVAVGGFVLTVGKLAGALGALVAPAITAGLPLVAAGFKAIGAALLANPIGVAVAAIAGGALLIIANWEKIKPAIQPVLDWIGGAIDAVQENAIRPFISLMSDGLSGIAGAWQGVRDAIGGVLDWMGEKFDWILGKLQPLLDKLQWVQEKGVGVISSVTDFFGFGGDEDPTERAIGGAFGASRPLLVGERGPELIYPNQGGFVAHHRAVERLAQLSAQARTGIGAANENTAPNIGRLASEIGSIGRAVAAAAGAMVATSMSPSPAQAAPQIVPVMQQVAPVQMLDFTPPQSEPLSMPQPVVRSGDTIQNQGARSASVVQNITINAPQNMDVQQLVAELERLKSLAQNDALFDGANDWGQYA